MNRIGFTEAYNIIGYVAASHILQKDLIIYDLPAAELWERSVRSATSMQILGQQIKSVRTYTLPDSGIAYTVGLLHSIGMMLINRYHESYPIGVLRDFDGTLAPVIENELLESKQDRAHYVVLHVIPRFAPEATGVCVSILEA